jgi:predicted nuclease of predicted toxin-antitoxin system
MTFLVDVNLPRFFSKFQHGDFIFVFNIDQQLADSELWKLALMNDYVILTRDMDF